MAGQYCHTIFSVNTKKQRRHYGARFSRVGEAGTTPEASAGHSRHALRLWDLFIMRQIAVIKFA